MPVALRMPTAYRSWMRTGGEEREEGRGRLEGLGGAEEMGEGGEGVGLGEVKLRK